MTCLMCNWLQGFDDVSSHHNKNLNLNAQSIEK